MLKTGSTGHVQLLIPLCADDRLLVYTYLKFRSRALKTSVPVSLFSASSTNLRKLSYMTGSKNAKSWKRIGRPRMYFRTWRFRYIGHNSFWSKHSPRSLVKQEDMRYALKDNYYTMKLIEIQFCMLVTQKGKQQRGAKFYLPTLRKAFILSRVGRLWRGE